MRLSMLACLTIVFVSAAAAVAGPNGAGAKASAVAAPGPVASLTLPARPVALTPAQYQALHVIQSLPEHRKVLGASATYSAREKNLQFTRFSDDFWTVAYDVGWPGFYLALLICSGA